MIASVSISMERHSATQIIFLATPRDVSNAIALLNARIKVHISCLMEQVLSHQMIVHYIASITVVQGVIIMQSARCILLSRTV